MKNLLVAVAVGVSASLAMAGCATSPGPTSTSPSTPSGPVTLTFWHGYTEADGKVLDKIVDDFNGSQSGITINTTTKTWAVIGDTLLPALTAKQGPDIVALPAENLPVYASKGAFATLDDFFASDSTTNAALRPGAVDMVKVNDAYYGVPLGFVPLSVVYNKTLFDKAGISSFPKTWDEWVAASKKLTIDKNNDGTPEQYGLALPDHATVGNGVWPSLFYGNGGAIVDGPKSVLDSAENLATLTYWANAVKNDKISPTGLDGIASDKLFSSGKAAMEVGGPWMASVASAAKISYGIAAIPAGPKGPAASAIGISAAVTSQTDPAKRAAAQQFFAYLFTKDVATQWSLGSGWPPLRTDIASSAVASNPVVATLTEVVQDARPLLPGVANSVDVLAAMDEATQKAMAGGDPASLLKTASAGVQTALEN